MGVVVDLSKMKIKVLFGSLKASKINLILFIVYSLGMLPAVIVLSTATVELLQRGVDLSAYVDMLAAILSGFMALVLAYAYTGFRVFEYEQEFILTSPITPRRYLLASLLSDMIIFLFFVNALPIFFIIIVARLSLAAAPTLLIILSILSFILFSLFLKYSFSIFTAVYKGIWLKVLMSAIGFILLFPAISLFTPFPLKYSMLPYPTTFLAECIIKSLLSEFPTYPFSGLGLYFLASLATFLASSKKNFFPYTNPVPLISPFDASIRAQSIKIGRDMKTFSHIGLRITLNLESKSLLRFLMKKEFLRMVRDGSLFNTLLTYIILSLITIFTAEEGAPMPTLLTILIIYSLLVPSMLTGLWRVVEMDSLWIPLTSGMNLENFVKAVLYNLTIISFSVPAAFIAILTLINQINPLIPFILIFSISMIGCSTNLYITTLFLGRKHRAASWMMISWISLLLTTLLSTPTYIFSILSFLWNFSLQLNATLSTFIIAYSTIVFTYLSKVTSRKASSIEL